jgi:hypothetical protein
VIPKVEHPLAQGTQEGGQKGKPERKAHNAEDCDQKGKPSLGAGEMGPVIYGMLTGEGQAPHGSVALRALEKHPRTKVHMMAQLKTARPRAAKKVSPDPMVREAMMAPGPRNLIISLSSVDLIASLKGEEL